MKRVSKNRNKISAFIVAYHEENLIERCLRSLVDVVDEIIVVHDGPCLDKTIKIAQKYTSKVFETKVKKELVNHIIYLP